MKNLVHKSLLPFFFILVSLFIFNNSQAQSSHEQLWGVWSLDSVELTKNGNTEKYSIETLLANQELLPRNIFTRLYFFSDQIGISTTEEIFLPDESHNLKGSFTIEGDILYITLQGEQPRKFTYLLGDEFLKTWYRQDDKEFYLVFKLLFKI